ncbi:MAG: hypothetical protein R3F53_19400 [Gammaproteobacteria bacterium]
MIEYGFQRLVLLNSADYSRAELPLDDSVSLIAPNNTGKTSLINALQFLLIIDRRRMDFGAHGFDKTRRFYFPGNNAYILLEVSLPQSGTVVLGCVGKGTAHDYEYFAYQGSLDIEDYRLPDDTLVTQPQLVKHLAGRERLVFRYSSQEFRELLYGGRRVRTGHEPDFTVFRLEHASDAQVFQQVLTRTLRLDKLNSSDVKAYLLQIFKRDLPHDAIDFKQVWDKAFAEVNAERAQYQAALEQREQIAQLAQQFEQRRILRGKLIDWRPRVEQGLTDWQSYYRAQCQALVAQESQLKEAQHQHTRCDRELTEQKLRLEQQLQELKAIEQQQAQLSRRFELVNDRQQLDAQLQSARRRLDAQTTLIGQVNSRNPTALRYDQKRLQREQIQLQQQLVNLGDNLYRRLSEALPAADLDRLNRVLSAPVMSLGPADFQLDTAQLQQALAQGAAEQLQLAGLSLSLQTLSPQHSQLSETEINARLADVGQQLTALAEQLEAAEQMAQALAKKQRLEQEQRKLEQELADYDTLQTLLAAVPERQARQAELNAGLRQVIDALARSQETAEQLREQFNTLGKAQSRLEQQQLSIEQARRQRSDSGEPFSYLAQLDHQPWLGEPEWTLDELADKLQIYQRDCRQLRELDNALQHGLAALHAGGLTKYQYSENREAELRYIINFSQQLPQEAEVLEKKARSAVVNVTASLRELRDGLLAFKSRMREFNRLIGHRQLSDLKTFRIEPEDETYLVEAINILIDTAAQVDSGDSFELFNQASILDDAQLERAKQILVNEGNARQGLKVADLFRLEFVVGKIDQPPESFQDIDSAASNGTVLMAKLVTGLAMLHLMQDKRHQVRAVCYLDEALALDARNQISLIETAREFGFALIFASPAPLTTVRYCVPIQHRQGRNHISRQYWQILEPLDGGNV